MFNIFINDIFFFVEKSEICNFADDNTIHSCGKGLPKIKEDLICTTKNISKVVSATFLLVRFLSLKESNCETWKNGFYFTSKALSVLEKIKF